MEHGIFRPLLFELFDGQSLEYFLAPEEIVLERRNEQALAEASRTAEEINSSLCYKVVQQGSLVHIDKTIFSDSFECLYSDRVFHSAELFDRRLIKLRKSFRR